jgi:hypothetical protein
MANHAIAERIIGKLSRRGGFDAWWDDIDRDIRQEIRDEMAELIPAEEPQPKAQEGWLKAEALPSWLTGIFWLQFDDGSVGTRPTERNNGRWVYLDSRSPEHAPVIAFCPAKPPAPPKADQ